MRFLYSFFFLLFATNVFSQNLSVTENTEVKVLSSDSSGVVMEVVMPSLTKTTATKVKATDDFVLPRENELPFFVEAVELGGEIFQRLTLKGLGHIIEEGKPQLPIKGILLQIPENAQVSLSVESKESMIYSNYRIPPNPKIERYDPRTEVSSADTNDRLYFDTKVYSKDAFYPQRPAEIQILGFLRAVRVANLTIYPIQYNPIRNEIKFHRRLQLTVSFQYPKQSLNQPGPSLEPSIVGRNSATEHPDFQQIYRNFIVNFNPNFQLNAQRSNQIKSTPARAPRKEGDSTSPVYKFIVDKDGIYNLTYRDLEKAGVYVSEINPRTLKLTNKGKEAPIFVSGEKDGVFDPTDYIEFQGEFNRGTYSLFGEYTTENVYWLSWGGKRGMRMVVEDGTPQDDSSITRPVSFHQRLFYRDVVHFEQDAFRGSLGYVDEKRDLWFWKNMAPDIHQFPFEIHDIQPNSEAIIRIMFHGRTLSDHNISAFVNNVGVANFQWNGQKKYLLEVPLDSILLKEGENILQLTLGTDTSTDDEDIVYLNWFEVDYWRALRAYNNLIKFEIPAAGSHQFKITGFTNPNIEIYKNGFSKLINVKIERENLDESNNVLYAAIFSDEIAKPTQYIALTTDNKKNPKKIIKDEPSHLHSSLNGADYIMIVYDDFYDDVMPLAKYRSKDFRVAVVKVQDIYDEFSGGLLTPEAIKAFISYAYHHWQPPAPSYILLIGDASWNFKKGKNYVPAYYVHTHKWGQTATDHSYACVNGDDPLPDLFIGRITARTKEEASSIVNKIIRYDSQPVLGDWRRHLLMLAGAGGGFVRDSEQLLNDYVPIDLGYKVARVYTDTKSPYYGDTAQLLDFWNAGASFVHFTGHGGGSIWSDAKLFSLDDVKFLSNKEHPAFVTSFTCFTSYFDDPRKNGLNEALVNIEEGGAIASFGSTGLGWVRGDYYMEQGLFNSLFNNGNRRIGKAVAETKVWMLLNTYHSLKVNMVSLFNLLGDPASAVSLPRQNMDVMAYLAGGKSPQLPLVKGEIEEKSIELRGVIDEKFNGQVLIEVYTKEPKPEELQIYFPDYQTTLPVKNGKFGGRLIKLSALPLIKGESSTKRQDITIRCYAWNDAEDIDVVGATILRAPGKDEIDLSIFSDDIQFTAIPSTEGNPPLRVKLQATIYNLGQKEASSVKVRFYSGPPFSGGRMIGIATIPSIAGGQSAIAEIDYIPSSESEDIYVHIDPLNEIVENNETNNEEEKNLIFNGYAIKPEGNLDDVISSLDGNLIINVPEDAVSEIIQLTVESIAAPRIVNQPDLQYAPLSQKANGGAYRLSISDENAINTGKFSLSLTFRYDTHHPANSETSNLAVYQWREDENLWEIAAEDIQRELGMVKANVNQLGIFSLLHNTDSLPPIIQLTLADEQFAHDGVFASQTPTLSATIEDANGVGKVQVFINGKAVESEALEFSRSPSPANVVVVDFTPTLDIGDYLFAVEAFDLNGNSNQAELSFQVGGELKLLNVANHPNPFNPSADKETRFTYVLTQPVEDVSIKIYSTSGRLIHHIQDASQRQGYNDVPWDGKDRDGEIVANGVYFYKIIVQAHDSKLSRIGKLAVIR